MTDAEAILEVDGLRTHYPIREGLLRREVGRIKAVDGVTFTLHPGEALGLVGESGSGKTTVAHSIIKLVDVTDGEIRFDGRDVTSLSGDALRAFRRRVQLVVQDPNDAFSPRMRVGETVEEPLMLHGMSDGQRRRSIVEDILERVGLSASDADRYPHEFSGGEKQRIAIARALVLNPDVIIADEPTSALDGRVQADILDLLNDVRQEFDIAVLFITHNMDVVEQFCDRIAVMYLGEIAEIGTIEEVLSHPAHPYTRVLVGSVPSFDPTDRTLARPLTDTIPDPADPPSGCRFHTRCPEVIAPEDLGLDADHWWRLAAFRFTLQAGELPETLRLDGGTDELDVTAVRAGFDLEDPVPVDEIEAAVETAAKQVVDGDLHDAGATMAAVLPTVCEAQTPITAEVDEGHLVHCHRYDAEVPGGPLPPEAGTTPEAD